MRSLQSVKAEDILRATKTILVVDWPSRDVPATLVRAGYDVVVRGGPARDHYSTYVGDDGEVVEQRTGGPPERADLVYSYRPVMSCHRSSSTRNGSARMPSGFRYPPRSHSGPG